MGLLLDAQDSISKPTCDVAMSLRSASPWRTISLARALIAELLNLADNWLHILRIELMVFTDNASGIALYRKFGFEIEGTHRADVLRDGKLVDGYSMARFH